MPRAKTCQQFSLVVFQDPYLNPHLGSSALAEFHVVVIASLAQRFFYVVVLEVVIG